MGNKQWRICFAPQKKLKDYLDVEELVLVSSGTLALQLALRSLALQGEVTATPFTFVATTHAILWEDLTPVFADINHDTCIIDPRNVEKKIKKKTSSACARQVCPNNIV